VVFSSRAPQFQRSQSANPAQDSDTPFAQMLEASAPPPADPAPRRTEPSEAAAPPQKAEPADPKKKTASDKPESKAAEPSESGSDEASPEDKVVVEAAEGSEETVVEEALPDIPQTDETAEDGTETADPEIAVVQVQTETAQPKPAVAPQIAAVTPVPATPEVIAPAPAEGDAIPEIAGTPVDANAPAAKPAPEVPVAAPVADAPDVPLTTQVKGGEDIPEIKGKPELKTAELQTGDGAEQDADAETQSLLPQQSKVEHARPQSQQDDAKLQQTDDQPKETKPAAESATSSKPAVPQLTGFEPDAANTPLPQTQPTLATDMASLTAGQQRAAVTAQTPVPVSGIAVEIAAQAKAGNNRFEIRLDPPELGRIDVRLDVDNDGNVKSRLIIDRADTYDLLRKDASTLERALQQAGLKTSDSGLEFTLRDQGSAQREARDQNQRNTERGIIPDADVLPADAASGYGRVLGLGTGVDIRI
jgi:chemotaxis protein MotD